VSGAAYPVGVSARDVAHERAPVRSSEPAGAYQHLVVAAPAIAALARPGQFVAATVGGATSGMLLRRSFSIHAVDPDAGTVEVVVAAHAAGTTWITERRIDDVLDLVGPLGQAFPLPDGGGAAVLVGGGYGSAPLFWLAQVLRQRGVHVEIVLGAASADRLFGVALAAEVADAVEVTTDDGSAGTRGWVSDVLPEVLARSAATDVYACGPMAMLRSVTEAASAAGAAAHVAVEEAMACGVGVCMTCVMPVIGADGRTRMVRACLDGPVFDGDRVRWDAFGDGLCRVPDDAVGAPQEGGH
jgi:dihydroorotate dehydrogenase electron transfer subunit